VCDDVDGVVAVPASDTEQLAETAERIEQIEQDIVAAVHEGTTLRAARAELGYHDLQRRRS